MAVCEFCRWIEGHDMNCPCNVPVLIEQWKKGYMDALTGQPMDFRPKWWRKKHARGKEAYELGYRQGTAAKDADTPDGG